ncbi:hypothetical protein LTR08_007582 [Meristemomyces frigidus]|nr:hypothetical protein LTR08_007582 [Meristemomyces frigidus]
MPSLQEHLPAGWRVQNSSGTFSAPAQSYSDEEDEGPARPRRGDDGLDEEDLRPDSPGWEDVEPEGDVEVVEVICLGCEEVFGGGNGGVRGMVGHCLRVHGVDLDGVRKGNAVDFLATIRLVNYIRHHYAQQPPTQQTQQSTTSTSTTTSTPSTSTPSSSSSPPPHPPPSFSTPTLWAADTFLQPVLENDALLYSITDLADPDDPSDPLAETEDVEAEGNGVGREAARAERVVVGRALG